MARSRRNEPMNDKTAKKLARELKRTRRVEREESRRERMHPSARTEPYDFREEERKATQSGTHNFGAAIDAAVREADEAGVPRFPRPYPLDGPGPYGERRT